MAEWKPSVIKSIGQFEALQWKAAKDSRTAKPGGSTSARESSLVEISGTMKKTKYTKGFPFVYFLSFAVPRWNAQRGRAPLLLRAAAGLTQFRHYPSTSHVHRTRLPLYRRRADCRSSAGMGFPPFVTAKMKSGTR
jgi:hypothetical protein